MEYAEKLAFQLMEQTIGLPIEIISNDYREIPIESDINNSYQEIVFQIKEDDPDTFSFGVLFFLSLLSFQYAAPRGSSDIDFEPDQNWDLALFLNGLKFRMATCVFNLIISRAD